jgi:phosphatidylserine/phosphatidylglycerophosphate/cardiolipin synthase-like enzyme
MKIHMGPVQLGAPDDLEEAITGFIDDARERLLIAVQELESLTVTNAILRARARGVRIRMILEAHYLGVDHPLPDPWQAGGENEANRQIITALLRAGIDVVFDLNPATFHQKFVVRDPEGSRAAVLTGSTNFTPTGIARNLNHVVIIEGRRVSGLYLDEFEEAWSGTFGIKRERHEPRPRTYRVAKVMVKVLFAPDHTPELEIMKQMLTARKRVDFAMFTFAQSSGIDDAMICVHRSGVPVRGVLDRRQANQKWAATRPISNAGAKLWWPRTGIGVGKVHHKLMIVDEEVIVVGSFNFTGPANRINDENIIVIGNILETDAEALKRQRRIGTYAREEIDRIISNLSEPIP